MAGFLTSILTVSCRPLEKADALSCFVSSGPVLDHPRGGHIGGIVDGHIVIAGGSNWSSDRITKTWFNDSRVLRHNHWEVGPSMPVIHDFNTTESVYHCDDIAVFCLLEVHRSAALLTSSSDIHSSLKCSTCPAL